MTALVEQRMDFRTASAAAGAAGNDAPWLAALRARGAAIASEAEWPDSRANRPWKYFEAARFGLAPETSLGGASVEVSGAPEGVAVRFAEATGAAAEFIARTVGTVVSPEADRLTALHYAYLGDGILITVPANTELSETVRLTRTVSGSGVSAPHTLIVTGANSRVTVVEEFVSNDEPNVALPASEILPGPGSEVQYYCVHRWGTKTKVFANQRFLGKERDAALKNLHMVLGGEVVKGHLDSTLEARGTVSELLGVVYGTGGSHADFYTLQDHIGPDTRSDLKYKSALKDEAQSVYYGVTKVGLGAKNADANQENRNLLLSKSAKADSDPVLEILTSDIVRASHGATAGPVDQDQLFYMQARGIPYAEAESLLVTAFLEDVLSRIPNLALREELAATLEEALDQ